MRRVGNFFYYLMLMPLVMVATLLLLFFIWGVFNLDDFYWFLSDFIPREVVFWFFVGIVAIIGLFLLYNTGRFVVSSVQKKRLETVECLIIGVPMFVGVNILIHFILNSGGFDKIVEKLFGGLFI